MREHRVIKAISVVIGAAFLSGAALPSAIAAEEDPASITAIESVTPEVLYGLASSADLRSVTQSATQLDNGASVQLPAGPTEPLVLEDDLHPDLSLVLPITTGVVDTAARSGLPVYEVGSSVDLVPAVKDDGSVQIITVLKEASAPSRYDYGFSAGLKLQLAEDGFVLITDEADQYVGAVTPPWAVDATGAVVPTRFEVSGSTLTQIVEHAGFIYPVVADPYAGKALISSVGVGSEKGQPRYSVTKTTFGHSVSLGYGLGGGDDPLLGAQIMRDQGWSEAVSKGLGTATTIRQQYDCHTVYAAGKNPWNLERWRGTNDWWGINPQLCNW
ncbi:hypothetical protein SRABI44_02482 [Microbacterium foliorum]|nr:hypothetical protein SRABI03_01575 [Microbacterium foliorum]CAH0223686.1 hypothetical protein SRABI44_02482 [Microbacterium foliorum]